MKKYYISIIITAMLFCGTLFSQEIILPQISISTTPDIDVGCRGGVFDLPVTISKPYTVSGIITALNLRLSIYGIRVDTITGTTDGRKISS